jgi:hypothetical protein
VCRHYIYSYTIKTEERLMEKKTGEFNLETNEVFIMGRSLKR